MAKTPKRIDQDRPEEVETDPDAWERFKDALNKVTPPKPKEKSARDE